MNKTPLKFAIDELFDDVVLSRDELAALRKVERQAHGPVESLSRRRFLAAAAGVSAVAVTGGVAWHLSRPADLLEQIFDEVASVHLSKHPLHFQASSITELTDEFAPQGFMVSDSAPLQDLAGEMTGGRYCWLLKQAAAEFRYALSSGGWATVIQTAYSPDIFGQIPDIGHGASPIVRFIRGLGCGVWCDRGMIYTKARPA